MRNQNKLLLVACVVLWGMNGCTLDYPVEVGDKCFEGDTLTDKDGTLTDKRLNKIYTKQGVITCAWNEAKKMFEAICEENVEDCESYQYYCDKSFCPKDYQCVTDSRVQDMVYYECENNHCQAVGLAERSCVNTETGCAFWEHYESSQVDATRCRMLKDNKGCCCLNDDHHCGNETTACSARKGVVKSACRYDGYAPKCMDIMCDEYYIQTEENRFKCKPMTNCKANEHLSENEQHEVICEANDTHNCGSRGYACSEKVPGWQSGRCDIEDCDDPDKTECNASCVVVDCKDGYIKTEDGRCEAEFFCSSDKHIYGEQCELNDDYHCGEHDNKCNAITESCDVNHGVCICKKGYMKYKDLCIKELSDECGVDNYITTIFDQKLVRAYCIDSDEAFNTLLEEADKGNVWPEDNYDRAYALMTDIQLGERKNWVPHRAQTIRYIEGNHHSVSGTLYCDQNCSLFDSFVGTEQQNGKLRNIAFGFGINGHNDCSILAQSIDYFNIENVSINSEIMTNPVGNIGSVAVMLDHSQLDNVSYYGMTSSSGAIVGGIVAIAQNSKFNDVVVGGYSVFIAGHRSVGGVVGDAVKNVQINRALVTKASVYGYSEEETDGTGGVIGLVESVAEVDGSCFSGTLMGNGNVGGIIGYAVECDRRTSISNSGVFGTIYGTTSSTTPSKKSSIGGLFGKGVTEISTSFNAADLRDAVIGAQIGYVSSKLFMIDTAYSTGKFYNVNSRSDDTFLVSNVNAKLVLNWSHQSSQYDSNYQNYIQYNANNEAYYSNEKIAEALNRADKAGKFSKPDVWKSSWCRLSSGPAQGTEQYYHIAVPVKMVSVQNCNN